MTLRVALLFASIAAATADIAELEHHDPQILARANLASDGEDSAADHETRKDNNGVDGVDDGNSGGVDDLDLYLHDNDGGHLDDYDNKGDNRINIEEDEGFAGLSNGGDDSGDDGDHGGEVEEENHVESNSELTDIGSTSDAVKVVSAPKKKRVRRGRGY